jgi:hypothetical protein
VRVTVKTEDTELPRQAIMSTSAKDYYKVLIGQDKFQEAIDCKEEAEGQIHHYQEVIRSSQVSLDEQVQERDLQEAKTKAAKEEIAQASNNLKELAAVPGAIDEESLINNIDEETGLPVGENDVADEQQVFCAMIVAARNAMERGDLIEARELEREASKFQHMNQNDEEDSNTRTKPLLGSIPQQVKSVKFCPRVPSDEMVEATFEYAGDNEEETCPRSISMESMMRFAYSQMGLP